MVYATEETPLGTAGSVRNAMDELDERFLVISGDVLTDIDLAAIVDVPRRARGAGHHRPGPRSRTRSSSASSSPTRTARSSASSRSRRGARCSATPSTPASSCSSPRSSTTSRPTGPSTSPSEVFPALLADGKPLFGAVAEGYWEDVGTLEAYLRGPQGHPRRQGRRSTSPASSSSDGVWLGEGAEIHPEATVDGPGGHRRQLPGRGRRPHRRVHGARHATSGCGPTPTSSARSCTTTPTSARACGCAAPSSAAPATCARGVRVRGGRRARRRVLRRRERRARPGREGLPVQDGRGGRRRQLLDRLGVARRPAACSAATAWPGLANVDITPELATRVAMAYGTHAQEGHHGHHLARLEPRRPACSSGR